MASFLSSHPFAVEASFDYSLVLTYAFPQEALQHMIPACLTLDTFDSRWAFVAIAMVQTRGLRPKGFPMFLGNSFFLTGFRIFVRYQNVKGNSLRGLYILRSESDKRKMVTLGNIFTGYRYYYSPVDQKHVNDQLYIQSHALNTNIRIDAAKDVLLPESSPFASWKEARRYAGPLPFTFSFHQAAQRVVIVEGVRSNWKPEPVQVLEQHTRFFETMNLPEPVLSHAFILRDIPYYWKKGVIEKWPH